MKKSTKSQFLWLGLSGLLGWLFAQALPYTLNGKFWEVLTAIGTTGAVITALGIHLTAQRRERKDSVEKANLVAARISSSLSALQRWINWHACQLDFYKNDEDRYQGVAMLAASNNEFTAISTESLAALIPISRTCAHRIARAIDLVNVTKEEMKDFSKHDTWVQLTKEFEIQLMNEWSKAFVEAGKLLTIAQRQIKQVAWNAAPHPSYDELHHD